MVDNVRHADGGHLFVVKGGTAMQLRLGIQARATTDLDVTRNSLRQTTGSPHQTARPEGGDTSGHSSHSANT
jgi:Nucleotidyl transferase AbiEii toxin, Type IV TA system